MKNFKKILCAFIAIAITVSCIAIPAFAEEAMLISAKAESVFPDVVGTEKYAEAVKVLNKLSIINGRPDGTFGPMDNVTRSEFAAMLLRMLGMDQTTPPAEKPFSDVDLEFWAAGTINVAKTLGIITGYEDGTFRPLNNVSYEEALTMIIRAIGYENYSAPPKEDDPWYQSYYTSAQRLKITENAVGSLGTPATRSCIAQLIYDTLDVGTRKDGLVSDTTIMEAYLGIYKEDGILASNTHTSLDSPDVNLKNNEVMIMITNDNGITRTQTYKVENMTEYDDALGASITFYYKPTAGSDYDEIIMFDVKKNIKKETVSASMLEPYDSSATQIAYYKDEKASNTSKYSLDSENVVIYNGKLWGNTAGGSRFDISMLPTVGQVSLLNRDNDSDYDVIFIDSYELYAVSAITASNYTITDKITDPTANPARTIKLDYTDDNQIISFITPNGGASSFSSIKKNTAICVKESHSNSGTKLITVVVMGSGVNGEIKSSSAKGVTIGTREYKYSPAAPWMNAGATVAPPEMGERYTFFMDINNEIFAYMTDENAAKTSYGYIIDCNVSGDSFGTGDGKIQLLTQSGSKQWYSLYANTKINDVSIDEDYEGAIRNLMSISLREYGVNDYKQLVKYSLKTVKGQQVFDEIVPVTTKSSDGAAVDDETLVMYDGFTRDDDTSYTKSSGRFDDSVFRSSAIIFVVPESGDAEDFRIGSSSDFSRDGNYNVEVFDITTSNSAKAIVLYGASNAVSVNYDTPLFRFDRYETHQNPAKNETMDMVYGYENGSKTETSYWISPDSEVDITELDEGTLVQFGFDSNGFATLESEYIYYEPGDTTPFYFAWDNDRGEDTPGSKEHPNSDTKIMLGTLCDTDGEIIIALDPTDSLSDLTQAIRLEESKFNSTNFYEYDLTGNKLEITHIGTGKDQLLTLDEGEKILVHLVSGTPKMVITFVEEAEEVPEESEEPIDPEESEE